MTRLHERSNTKFEELLVLSENLPLVLGEIKQQRHTTPVLLCGDILYYLSDKAAAELWSLL